VPGGEYEGVVKGLLVCVGIATEEVLLIIWGIPEELEEWDLLEYIPVSDEVPTPLETVEDGIIPVWV